MQWAMAAGVLRRAAARTRTMASDTPLANAMRLRNQLQSVYKLDPLRNEEEVNVKIKELNEHIVCILCAGYFVDATTITECLHTFCKSCIVKYLQTSKHCPMCNIKIHETQPLLNLKLDRVMQEIVYKLVPGLQNDEERRIREFYQSRGLDRVVQAEESTAAEQTSLQSLPFDLSKAHYYCYDELVRLCLERHSSRQGAEGKEPPVPVLKQKFVRCSVRTTVSQLRQVLSKKLGICPPSQVFVHFEEESLLDDTTLKEVWLTYWYQKPAPLLLYYSISEGPVS
ncbi:polycomb group RING finger protein 1 [Lampetra fluviatilis]